MPQPRILIVGASIAGPTAAYWFAKAGADITIIERFPQLRTGGHNVDIRATGVTVMRKMAGLEEAVRAKVVPMDGMSFVRDDGRPYGTITASGNPDQQSLVSEYEIFRGDLGQILFDMTKDHEHIKYVFGEQVVSMQQVEQTNGPVTVEFANGLPTTEYDLVVACDGANSRMRALGLGCTVREHIEPANCWAAFFSIDKDLLGGSRIEQAHSAPGGRFFSISSDPSGISRINLMAMHPHDQRATALFIEAAKQGDGALKQFVARNYEGAGWKIDEVVSGMINATDFYANEIVQVKTPSLSNGRFVLVGDAGYAPGLAGGGTSLAMTGAYVLAGEVGKHRGDIEEALRGYEKTMRPIIVDLQKVPPLVTTLLAPQTAWGIWLRNNLFAFIAWTRIAEFAQSYLAGVFASPDKFPLPDYEWLG